MTTTANILQALLAALLSLLFCFLFTALLLGLTATSPKEADCKAPGENTVYVASNGVHLSLILPAELTSPEIRNRLDTTRLSRYISYGWGDSTFYINTPEWKDLRAGIAVKAMFVNSPSAMHIYYFQTRASHWRKLSLCTDQLNELNEYIFSSFKLKSNGNFELIEAAGYGESDQFYRAVGSYNMLYNSNNWVNAGLKRTSVRTAVWSPFDEGVLFHLKD